MHRDQLSLQKYNKKQVYAGMLYMLLTALVLFIIAAPAYHRRASVCYLWVFPQAALSCRGSGGLGSGLVIVPCYARAVAPPSCHK